MKFSKATDSIGKKYNMLQCISVLPRQGSRRKAVFLCDCGKEVTLRLDHVKSGRQKTCGCHRRGGEGKIKHGASKTKTYNSWNQMRERCKPSFYKSQNYYDRGITVEDPRWHEFPNFLADMGERPEGCSLDRIDNDRGYCKENCRWATRKEQQRNRRYCISREEISSFVSLYEAGRSIKEISEAHGRSHETVWRHLVNLGVHKKKS